MVVGFSYLYCGKIDSRRGFLYNLQIMEKLIIIIRLFIVYLKHCIQDCRENYIDIKSRYRIETMQPFLDQKTKDQIISESNRRISNGEFVDDDTESKAWAISFIILMIIVASLLILIM